MKLAYFLLLITCLLFSCKNNQTKQIDGIGHTVVEETSNTIPSSKKEINNHSRNLKLLQGLWQNLAEENQKLEFKNSRIIEITEGVQKDEGNVFTITDQCEQKNIVTPAKANDKIISIISLNRCYFIVQLDGNELKLGDLSNGKTLTYKKVSQ